MTDTRRAGFTAPQTCVLQVFDAVHVDSFVRMRAHPDVGHFMAGGRFDETEAQGFALTVRADAERLRARWGLGAWAACSVASGQVVGFVGFNEPEAGGPLHLWYFVDPPLWRRGHGASAVHAALLEKELLFLPQPVLALVSPQNRASQRLLLNCGFETVGLKPHAGALCTVFRFANPLNNIPEG